MDHEQHKPIYDWLASGEGETVWSYVMSIGRLHPLRAKTSVRPDDKLIIVIPGNPGHCQFYETFSTYLHQRDPRTVSVWVLSHVGHVRVPPELTSRDSYTTAFKSNYLSLQIEHKLDFLLRFVPKNGLASLNLIGHSIGCFVILELFDALVQNGIDIERAFLLFPTLERMRETPNGRSMLRLRNFRLNRLLDTVFPSILRILPDELKVTLVNWRCARHRNSTGSNATADQKVIQAAIDLLHGDVVVQAMEMGYDEMKNVRQLNEAVVRRYGEKLFLVHGAKDDWSPLSYREEFIQKFPNVKNVLIENHGVEHAFVIFDSLFVAELIVKHM